MDGKNISSFILLFLLWAGGGMECYKIKVIQDVGEKYKKMVILMICRQKKKTVQKSRKKNNRIYMDFVCVDLPLVFIGIGICFLDKRLWWCNDVLSTMGSE